MSSERSDAPVEDLKRFLAHHHGIALHDVTIRGIVPGEQPDDYAQLVQDAMQRAWRERGNRPLPPGYDGP
ncbi:MAG: hypothetical protein BRD38_05415 [Bacteroidetes bacterium QH_9_67_14]|nr:MAG: hypothetical protein BRD38_05415 [Bacteroidetes bacterium QH_9_67_14]